MASLVALKNQAKALGIPGSLIRASMNNPDTLAELIASFEQGQAAAVKSKKGGTKMARPVARAKAKAKVEVEAPKRRGRPPGSKNKPKVTAATHRQARRTRIKDEPVARKPVRRGRPPKSTVTKPTARKQASNNGAGRFTIGKLNYNQTDGWNPREGSAVDEIFQSLKKFKGDREKVFNDLKPDVWFFVGKTKADNTKHTMKSALAMLKYRIARTDYDFAKQTGQHESSTNRIKYGTGEFAKNGKTTAKRATKAAPRPQKPKRATKVAPEKPRRGRPPGSKNKPKSMPVPSQQRRRRTRTRSR